MKITYDLTNFWINPKTKTKPSIPNGYSQILNIMPQGKGMLEEEEIKRYSKGGQVFIGGNIAGYIFLQRLLSLTLNMVFGSVIII